VSASDPTGLYSWDDFGGDAANVLVGIGDGASFGLTRRFREAADVEGDVKTCSALYRAAEIVGGLLPVARVGYAFRVLRIPGKFLSSTRMAAEGAYAERMTAAAYYRGFLAPLYATKGNFLDDAAKYGYGYDWGQVIEAAGRPNFVQTAQFLTVGALAQVRSAIDW
jgi:hypothetical protein